MVAECSEGMGGSFSYRRPGVRHDGWTEIRCSRQTCTTKWKWAREVEGCAMLLILVLLRGWYGNLMDVPRKRRSPVEVPCGSH